MDIQAEKLKIIELLLQTDNPSVLDKIKSIFDSQQDQDIWLELNEDQQIEIENALKEVSQNKVKDYQEFMAKHRK